MPKRKQKAKGSRKSVKLNVSVKSKGSRKGRRSSKRNRGGFANGAGALGLSFGTIAAANTFVSNWREPKWKHRSRRGCRLEHLELVSSVYGYTAFGETGSIFYERVNPKNASMFPFLSGIAEEFEMYRFHGFRLIYVPSVGTDKVGNVVLAPDYDASEAPVQIDATVNALTEGELLSMEDRAFGSVFTPLVCPFNQADMFPGGPYQRKYCAGYGDRWDMRNTDAGVALWTCYGAASDASLVGKLFVHYDAEFFVPARNAGNVMASVGQNSMIRNTQAQTVTTGVAAVLFAGVTTDVGGTSAGVAITNGVVTVPAGWYWVSAHVLAHSSAASYIDRVTLICLVENTATGGYAEEDSAGMTDTTVYLRTLAYVAEDGGSIHFLVTVTGAGTLTIVDDSSMITIERCIA